MLSVRHLVLNVLNANDFLFSRSGVPSDDLRIGVPSDDYAKLENKAAYRRPENLKNLTDCGQSNNSCRTSWGAAYNAIRLRAAEPDTIRGQVIHLVCDGRYGAMRCQYSHYQVQAAYGQEAPHMCVRLMSTCRTQGTSS